EKPPARPWREGPRPLRQEPLPCEVSPVSGACSAASLRPQASAHAKPPRLVRVSSAAHPLPDCLHHQEEQAVSRLPPGPSPGRRRAPPLPAEPPHRAPAIQHPPAHAPAEAPARPGLPPPPTPPPAPARSPPHAPTSSPWPPARATVPLG